MLITKKFFFQSLFSQELVFWMLSELPNASKSKQTNKNTWKNSVQLPSSYLNSVLNLIHQQNVISLYSSAVLYKLKCYKLFNGKDR